MFLAGTSDRFALPVLAWTFIALRCLTLEFVRPR